MTGELWLGVLFGVLTALATNLAFLWKHRGAVAAPPMDMRRPLASAAELFRSKWWTIGWCVAVVGWVFHVGALAFAPLSLAQAVIAGGFVILAVLADRMFGFKLHRRQWLGVGLVAVGLAFLGATTADALEQTRYSIIGIAIFQAVLLAIGLLLGLVTRTAVVSQKGPLEDEPPLGEALDEEHPRTGGPPQAPVTVHATRHHPNAQAGLLLGVAAGLLFGVSDISIKALAEDVIESIGAIFSPWVVTAIVASVGAFFASARSLQIGDGVSVIAATSAAANLSTIAGGVIVFGESLGEGTLEVTARVCAFGLVVGGAVLIPGPTRAAEAAAEHEREEQHGASPPEPVRGDAGAARSSAPAR